MHKNTLYTQTSPYLQKHSKDPVHWQPWGPEALAAAKKQNKPILLSIGYSACHWCHVMAGESFADLQTAELMNKFFINIKVDREERPDLDAIYQEALHLFGRQGGWPLTMFLTPEAKPFFGGTYFPAQSCQGQASFRDVVWQTARFWREDAQKVISHGQKVFQNLQEALLPREAAHALSPEKVSELTLKLLPFVDGDNGGFGHGAKFPNVPQLSLLWSSAQSGTLELKERKVLEAAVRLTLDKICYGGLYDHVGGGFFRYTVDPTWQTPHFEKMLIDNALLIDLLSVMWCQTKSSLYKDRIYGTVAWLLREMQQNTGGFATALDADSSDGAEGAFYLWQATEIKAILKGEAKSVYNAYGLDPSIAQPQHLQQKNKAFEAEEQADLTPLLQALFKARQKRSTPFRDEKILADANGLMVAALTKASQIFGEKAWLKAAEKAYGFMVDHLYTGGKLSYSWCGGKASGKSFAEGYAGAVHAALTLYEATMEASYLRQAEEWTSHLLKTHEDLKKGGFFQAPCADPDAILPIKPVRDNVGPSANGLMVQNFARLYYLTGAALWREQAKRTLTAFAGTAREDVFASSSLLSGCAFLGEATQIVLIGTAKADALTKAAWQHPASFKSILCYNTLKAATLPKGHPAYGKILPKENKKAAFLCRGQVCTAPMYTAKDLAG